MDIVKSYFTTKNRWDCLPGMSTKRIEVWAEVRHGKPVQILDTVFSSPHDTDRDGDFAVCWLKSKDPAYIVRVTYEPR